MLTHTRKNENIDADCLKDALGRKEVLLMDGIDCDSPGKPPSLTPRV